MGQNLKWPPQIENVVEQELEHYLQEISQEEIKEQINYETQAT